MKWLKSISTDENWDVDPILICILMAVVFDVVMTAIKGPAQFDAMSFGGSVATLLGAGGAGYAVKRLGEKGIIKNGTSPSVSES